MKRLTLEFLMWASILAALIIGNVYAIPSLAILATFLYWTSIVLVVLASIALSVSPDLLTGIDTKISVWKRIYVIALNVVSVSVLLYFHYPVLAIFLTLSAVLGQVMVNTLNRAYEVNTACPTK